MNEWMNERMNEWMNEWMNERTNERTNERMKNEKIIIFGKDAHLLDYDMFVSFLLNLQNDVINS